jgi:uncharacterized protein
LCDHTGHEEARVSLPDKVDGFVKWLFEGFQETVPRGSKIFNDAILGNQYFARHEVAVIDSPIIQRLKRIKQTGLVHFVFPSATHSRFEHSLGVATLADRCFTAIANRFKAEFPHKEFPANFDRLNGHLAHLRMAALLHDVGHGVCSHGSEQIYKALTNLREFRRDPKFVKNAEGEILSYFIIQSPTFRNWFNKIVVGQCHAEIDLDIVGNMILGRHDDPDLYFLSQIVSSPFDADKLDYIARDSYYCGLALTVDLARFYSMIATAEQNDVRCLVLRSYIPLEQILFSRMILFSSVYQHQKVKCLDMMLRATVQHILENPDQCAIELRGAKITFEEAIEYLFVTDDEFFNMQSFGDAYVKKMLDRFWRRDLFMRCVEVSRMTAKNWEGFERKVWMDLGDDFDRLLTVEQKIYRRLPAEIRTQCSRDDIKLSVPTVPSMKKDFAYIQTSPTAPVLPVEEFFPLEQWAESYGHNKWRSFIYAPREFARHVADAAIDVIGEMGLEIDRATSDRHCHLS